ncbi:trypsin-like peptidase domain-containing protein [Deinococcus deserti]|uniref:Putative trypsin-like serine protease n=1 Tax=Deinococcus deserti (strain DSM 17065 / CIP 109153 / LMG 22923 / VCD115) TaxID=546414 RepID=C1D0U5_DEIDV|nr:trypsin-like peptidase domain-containing protein [Deinococcus deserti]ACO45469.1 putative trypsin-like serine protease [Deinococcus deserti VCD115]
MKRPLFATTLVLVGLGLGATLLRDQVPPGTAQAPAVPQAERSARLQNEQNTMDIVRRYEPGLVFISTEQQVVRQDPLGWMFGGGQETQVQQGVGSGFFVNKAGDILTNYHVIAAESPTGAADRITIRLMGREESITARVIGLAPQYDLALIRAEKLDPKLITPIPLGNSDTLAVGQKAVAMGAPFGLDFSVTEGIVSNAARTIPIGFSASGEGIMQRAIQTDAAINPGNSGGPLLDSSGKVIGINTQIISPGVQAGGVGQNAGIGFAIPVNAARNLLPRLQEARGGVVSAPRLGLAAGLVVQSARGTVPAGLSLLSSEAKQQLKLPETGLVIGEVVPGSPAARAGLRGAQQEQRFPGGKIALGSDVIVKADGRAVDALEDLQAALLNKREGDQVTLQVVRGGERREVKVTLDASAFK